jgi:hypothetical protein
MALNTGKSRSVDAHTLPLCQRRLDGGFVLWILGTVFIAGEIAAVLMEKAVDRLHQCEVGINQRLQGVAAQQHVARLVATQPQPQRVLRRRNRRAGVWQNRKPAQACNRHAQRLGNPNADAHHNGSAVTGRSQLLQ